MIEAAPTDDDAMMESTSIGRSSSRKIKRPFARHGLVQERPRSSVAARRSRTRACSRCSTPSSTFLPSPLDIPPSRVHPTDTEVDAPPADDGEPFAALAFKIPGDPVGSLTFFRVYSGMLNSGDDGRSPTKGQEGAHRPPAADARQQAQEIKRSDAGDIAAAGRSSDVTPATRSATAKVITSRRWSSPSRSSRSRSSRRPRPTRRRWASRCSKLRSEDPSFRVSTDEETARRSSPAWASCTSRSSSTA